MMALTLAGCASETSTASSPPVSSDHTSTSDSRTAETERQETLRNGSEIEPGSETPQLVMARLAEAFKNEDVDLFMAAVCPPCLEDAELPYYRGNLRFVLTAVSLGPLLDRVDDKYGTETLRTALNKRVENGYEILRQRAKVVDFRALAEKGKVQRGEKNQFVEVQYEGEGEGGAVVTVSQPVVQIDGRWYFNYGYPMLGPVGEHRRRQIIVDFKENAKAALAEADSAEAFADRVAESLAKLANGLSPTPEERQEMNARRDKYINRKKTE